MAIRHLRVWRHCGWALTVDPGLEGEVCDGVRTLRLFDEAREISLSSNRIERTDGVPFRAEDVFGWFPPPHLMGDRFAHDDGDHVAHKCGGPSLWRLPASRGSLQGRSAR